MSQGNAGNENGDQDEEPTESSETSSSSCTTSDVSSTSSASSTSTSSSSGTVTTSDDENDNHDPVNVCRHRHKLCLKSSGLSAQGDGHDDSSKNYLDVNHESVVARPQQASTRQPCDTIATANCPCSTRSEFLVESYKQGQHQQCQASYTKGDAGSSPTYIQAPHSHHQSTKQTSVSKSSQTCSQSNYDKLRSKLLPSAEETNSLNQRQHIRCNLNTDATSLASSYSNLSSTTPNLEPSSNSQTQSRRTLKPAPSPSPSMSIIDTNNNKNNSFCSKDGLSSIKRTNFSKSASGSRLISKSRQNVCDCLNQDCGEKKHSNRRQYIEHYYNSRTQLPSANTSTSSFNISTPLNRLSECDAITRRLLSSPIRTTNMSESPTRRVQVTEVDKSRRASLGTNSITDQVFLFASNPLQTPEAGTQTKDPESEDNQDVCDMKSAQSSGEIDFKLKQQCRSLSVCDEETLNPRQRVSSTNYPSNLNRAISLACETGAASSARRFSTMIPLFGCDIKALEQFTKSGLILPPVIDSAVDHILVNGINSIGIFRKSGVKSRILSLRQRIEANQNIKFDEINQNNEFSIYDIADLVKMWFRELKPSPLMTKELIKLITASLTSNHIPQAALVQRGDSSQPDTSTLTGNSNISAVNYVDPNLKNKIDSSTTSTHRALLVRALNFLAQISARCEANQMTSQNLAICLTPSLCATESDQNSILLAQKALEYCIDNHRVLFGL